MNELNINEVLLNNINYSKYHPYLYHLNKVTWSIFGSLTWEYESRRKLTLDAEWKRRQDFKGLIDVFCIKYKLRKKALAFYQTTEYGKSSEPHYHFLIASHGLEHLPLDKCAKTLQELWQNELKPYYYDQRGIGSAVVKTYLDSYDHPAVKYCLKREFNSSGIEWERQDFLSPRLLKILHQIESYPTRELLAA